MIYKLLNLHVRRDVTDDKMEANIYPYKKEE